MFGETVSQFATCLPYAQMATLRAPDTVYHPSRLAGEVVPHLKGLSGASDGGEGRSVGARVALLAFAGLSAWREVGEEGWGWENGQASRVGSDPCGKPRVGGGGEMCLVWDPVGCGGSYGGLCVGPVGW